MAKQAEQLPGMETPPREVDLKRPNAFGRVCKPDYFGLSETDIPLEGDVDLSLVDPERLHTGIAVGRGEYTKFGVPFSPEEYNLLVLSPKTLARKARAGTLASLGLAAATDLNQDRAKRAGIHAIENRRGPLQTVIDGIILETDGYQRLTKEMKTPGYAHMREGQMMQLTTAVVDGFLRMLRAYGFNNNWDQSRMEDSKAALRTFLLGGKYHDRLGHWGALAGVANDYARRRKLIILGNINEINNEAHRLKKQLKFPELLTH